MPIPNPLKLAPRQKNHPYRFLALILFSLLPIANTHAEWLMVEPNSNVSDPFVVYIDSESIAQKNNRMTVRVLLNMLRRTDDGVASVIAIDEYDCITERMRTRSMASYAEIDGKGALVREFKSLGEWVKVEPRKINEAVMDSACPEQVSAK